jgi:hypothetical protein
MSYPHESPKWNDVKVGELLMLSTFCCSPVSLPDAPLPNTQCATLLPDSSKCRSRELPACSHIRNCAVSYSYT